MNRQESAPRSPAKRVEHVQSLERGLSVIKAFGQDRPRLTLAEVARSVGLARGAARRFLLTLQALGYIDSDGRYFRLKPQTLELGYAYLASQPWWRGAHRQVEHVAIELGVATAAGVLDRGEVLYVAHAMPQMFPGFPRSVGTRLPAYASAMGRVMLGCRGAEECEAYLAATTIVPLTRATVADKRKLATLFARARKDGFAVIEQELEFGLWSLAVPIFDRGGAAPAAIGVSVHDLRMTRKAMLERFLERLRAASREISAALPT